MRSIAAVLRFSGHTPISGQWPIASGHGPQPEALTCLQPPKTFSNNATNGQSIMGQHLSMSHEPIFRGILKSGVNVPAGTNPLGWVLQLLLLPGPSKNAGK